MSSFELDLRIEGEEHALGASAPAIALHMLRDAIDDIADRIEEQAREEAPKGKTGALQAHPVDRSDTRFGIATSNPLFGGGFAIRGPSGAFVPGRVLDVTPGRAVAHVELSVPSEPKHAVWVHNGTGIFGEYKTPIVPVRKPYLVFHIDSRKFVRKSVKGQEANPYLTRSYEIINRTYVPYRFERLMVELDAAFR